MHKMNESYFIDNLKRKNVINIFTQPNFKLANDFNCLKTIETCSISLEKADSYNLVQLRLMDANDPTKLFICTIDTLLYEHIKNEQSLHVTFQDFLSHLTTILHSCLKDELLLSLIKDEQKCVLQIYERRSFRNLIHLFLPMKQASIETVVFHINATNLSNLNELKLCGSQKQRLEQEISNRDGHINQLRSEIKRLNDVITEKDNMVFNRNCEEINKLQHTIKHLQDGKDTDEQKYKLVINQLQDQIENVRKENLSLNEIMKQETFKSAAIRDEINSFKLNNSNMRERNEKLQTELISYQNRDKKHEMTLNENRRLIQELNEKLKYCDKRISELSAELEAEKNICNTKKNALYIATEEISKANGIILKQAKEIKDLQAEIDTRTQVALKQEIYINEKEIETISVAKKLQIVQEEFLKCNQDHKDFALTFKRLQDNVQLMEGKYKSKIEELQSRIIKSGDVNVLANK